MSTTFVIIGILQVDTSEKLRLCKQQLVVYAMGNSFKI